MHAVRPFRSRRSTFTTARRRRRSDVLAREPRRRSIGGRARDDRTVRTSSRSTGRSACSGRAAICGSPSDRSRRTRSSRALLGEREGGARLPPARARRPALMVRCRLLRDGDGLSSSASREAVDRDLTGAELDGQLAAIKRPANEVGAIAELKSAPTRATATGSSAVELLRRRRLMRRGARRTGRGSAPSQAVTPARATGGRRRLSDRPLGSTSRRSGPSTLPTDADYARLVLPVDARAASSRRRRRL